MSFTYTTSTVLYAASFGGWATQFGDVYNVELWNSKGQASDELDIFEYATGNFSDSGLWVARYGTYSTQMRVYSCLAFDVGILPDSVSIVSAEIELTVAGISMPNIPMTIEAYKLLRNFTSSATLSTYNGSTGWYLTGLVAGLDYESTPIDTFIIGTSGYAGAKYTVDVTSAVIDAINREDKVVRLLFKIKDSELQAHISNKSKVLFYTGYQGTKAIMQWGGSWETYYPNYGNNTTDKPQLTIQYNVPLSVLTSDNGSLTMASQVISTEDGYHTIGYYLAGIFGEDQKYFVRNNSGAIVNDVCIWCDWARATVPVFSGAGSASMSYVTCQNGEAGKDSPSSQRWRMKCLTGGSNSKWGVEQDNGTYEAVGTSTWSAASPTGVSCNGITGSYTSTASGQGISFTLTATAPQINDMFTWETFANTIIPSANKESESMLMIAPDISGGPGGYKNIQPLHTTITVAAASGATQLTVLDNSIFSQDDNVVIYNLSTDVKGYNTIASVLTGGGIVLTGGVLWAISPGFQIYQAPLSVGTLDPITFYTDNYYKPFWLAVDVPAEADTGIYMARVQVTEGP